MASKIEGKEKVIACSWNDILQEVNILQQRKVVLLL